MTCLCICVALFSAPPFSESSGERQEERVSEREKGVKRRERPDQCDTG